MSGYTTGTQEIISIYIRYRKKPEQPGMDYAGECTNSTVGVEKKQEKSVKKVFASLFCAFLLAGCQNSHVKNYFSYFDLIAEKKFDFELCPDEVLENIESLEQICFIPINGKKHIRVYIPNSFNTDVGRHIRRFEIYDLGDYVIHFGSTLESDALDDLIAQMTNLWGVPSSKTEEFERRTAHGAERLQQLEMEWTFEGGRIVVLVFPERDDNTRGVMWHTVLEME